MFCNNCGNEIDEDSRFCRHCGAAQNQPVADSAIASPDTVVAQPSSGVTSAPIPTGSEARSGGQWIWALVIGGLFLVILAIVLASPSKPGSGTVSNDAEASAADLDLISENIATAADGSPKADANWDYSTNEDKVRGARAYLARTTSTNTIHQNPPYEGATTMSLTVRKHPEYGTDVFLTISSGQMMCSSYDGCDGTVRFDGGPPQRVRFNGTADDSSDTVFVVGAKKFIAQLKRAKKLVVEKTLYEAGNPQFEFNVADLKWDH